MSLPSNPMPTPGPSPEDLALLGQAKARYHLADSLLNHDGWKWFVATCLDVAVAEQQAIALDDEKTSEECDLARKLRRKLVEIAGWVEHQRAEAAQYVETHEPQ